LPFFEYVAVDAASNLKRGQMEAIDRQTVIDFLRSEDLLVVKVSQKQKSLTKGLFFSKKISYLEKINLTGNLATMIKAGVNLPAALDVLATDTRNSYFRLILGDLKFSVENGKPLSEGLKHYPKDFNPVFINMIKAGEASGKLDESLRRLNLQLKKEYALVSKVKNALIYPVVLIAGVLGVLALIITFVIPRLVAVFEGSSLKIPLTTRVLFFLAKMASFKPTLTMAILLILLAGGIYLLRLDKVKAFFNRLLYRLPIAKDLLRQLELVRFARTLGELLASGLAIGEALEITSEGMGLAVYRKIILEAREKVIKGVSLANAFRKDEKYFPGLLTSVISVGEKTGQLDKILLELADFYEEQADNSLKTLTSLIEPVLLVIVGLLIGGMAISIVVPIYQLIGTI